MANFKHYLSSLLGGVGDGFDFYQRASQDKEDKDRRDKQDQERDVDRAEDAKDRERSRRRGAEEDYERTGRWDTEVMGTPNAPKPTTIKGAGVLGTDLQIPGVSSFTKEGDNYYRDFTKTDEGRDHAERLRALHRARQSGLFNEERLAGLQNSGQSGDYIDSMARQEQGQAWKKQDADAEDATVRGEMQSALGGNPRLQRELARLNLTFEQAQRTGVLPSIVSMAFAKDPREPRGPSEDTVSDRNERQWAAKVEEAFDYANGETSQAWAYAVRQGVPSERAGQLIRVLANRRDQAGMATSSQSREDATTPRAPTRITSQRAGGAAPSGATKSNGLEELFPID